MSRTGLPIVSFTQNNKTFNFLIDSGADNSVLNSTSLNELDYIDLEGNRPVYGIDGNQVQTSFVGVKLIFQNHPFLEAFQVFEVPGLCNIERDYGIKVTGVLGGRFLKRYGFLIDFKQLKAYTDGKENQTENT